MKRFLTLLFTAFALAGVASAQTLVVNLTWAASSSSTTSNPGTVQIYRAPGSCADNSTSSGVPSGTLWKELTSTAPAAGSYIDSTVAPGAQYCYYATATVPGYAGPSVPSNLFQISVILSTTPAAPGTFTGSVVKQ